MQPPITVAEAKRLGLTWDDLQGPEWRRIARDAYLPRKTAPCDEHLLLAAWKRLPPGSAFSGCTAASLHGLSLPACEPIEATIPPGCGVSARSGLRVRRTELQPVELVPHGVFVVTCVVRTLDDLARRLPLQELVIVVDEGLHRRLIDPAQLANLSRLRRAASLADGRSESPMESRLRLLLVLAGLPAPLPQVEIRDPAGDLIGRADLYYPEARLVVEYDGSTHRETWARDLRRQNRLIAAGHSVLRFTGADLLGDPGAIVHKVRAALTR